MKWIALVLGLAILAAIALLSFSSTPVTLQPQARPEPQPLPDLPRREVLPMFALEGGARPDLVVFEDGEAGWFALDVSAVPEGTEIGFHGPRLFDAFTGNQHVATYCGGTARSGKIIWVIVAGEIVQDYAFCAPSRMDLGPLRAFAEPVELVTEQVAASDLETLAARIADAPDQAMVSFPARLSGFSHQRRIMGPYTWFPPGSGRAQIDMEDGIETAIMEAVGEARVHIRQRNGLTPNPTLYNDGTQIASGMGVNVDGTLHVIDGLWAFPFDIRVECMAEGCAVLDALNLAPFFAPNRDASILEEGLSRSVASPHGDDGPVPVTLFPTEDELLGEITIEMSDIEPITHQVRYIRRGAD